VLKQLFFIIQLILKEIKEKYSNNDELIVEIKQEERNNNNLLNLKEVKVIREDAIYSYTPVNDCARSVFLRVRSFKTVLV